MMIRIIYPGQEHLRTLSCRTAEVLLIFAKAQFRGAPVVAGPGAPQAGDGRLPKLGGWWWMWIVRRTPMEVAANISKLLVEHVWKLWACYFLFDVFFGVSQFWKLHDEMWRTEKYYEMMMYQLSDGSFLWQSRVSSWCWMAWQRMSHVVRGWCAEKMRPDGHNMAEYLDSEAN